MICLCCRYRNDRVFVQCNIRRVGMHEPQFVNHDCKKRPENRVSQKNSARWGRRSSERRLCRLAAGRRIAASRSVGTLGGGVCPGETDYPLFYNERRANSSISLRFIPRSASSRSPSRCRASRVRLYARHLLYVSIMFMFSIPVSRAPPRAPST